MARLVDRTMESKPTINFHRLFGGQILAHYMAHSRSAWAKGATVDLAMDALDRRIVKMMQADPTWNIEA